MIAKPETTDASDLAATLAQEDYLRQRYAPQPRDPFYLPLADILSFLLESRCLSVDTLLDYGCGGSPYRNVFKTQHFIRADFVAAPGVDFQIADSGALPLPDNSCDAVLSTQVLEHVYSPNRYLAQAHRVLRSGGKLILTTNGIWEDHGCPNDFWRWTADGLRREIEAAGFAVESLSKLTTGPRAILFLLESIPSRFEGSCRSLRGTALRMLHRCLIKYKEAMNCWSDRYQQGNRVVRADADGHRLYIGIGVVAMKRELSFATGENPRPLPCGTK